MRRIATVLAFLLFLVAPVMAAAAPQVFDTPQALLDYAYKPYATGNFQDDNDILYSKSLNAMFAAAEAATGEDEVGPVDFDVFVNGQDYQLSDLQIGASTPEGDGVTVPVTLKNFDTPQALTFHLIREGGGWRISDIESTTPGDAWRLTTLLTPDTSDDSDSDAASPPGEGMPPALTAPPPKPDADASGGD